MKPEPQSAKIKSKAVYQPAHSQSFKMLPSQYISQEEQQYAQNKARDMETFEQFKNELL